MSIIGIVSFFLAIVSILFSLYSLSKKNNCKNLCILEIAGKRNIRFIVLYNCSDFYITKNDVFKDLLIKLSNNKSRIFNYSKLASFEDSSFDIIKVGNDLMMRFDSIAPRDFAILQIKCKRGHNLNLVGILENCRIIKKKMVIYRLMYNGMVNYILAVAVIVALFLLFVYAFLVDDIGNSKFSILAKICFFLSMATVYPAIDFCKKFLFVDEQSYKRISKIINNQKQKSRQREKGIRANYRKRKSC